MRGRGHGSRTERGAAPFRFTYIAVPCFLTFKFVRRVHSQTFEFEGGIGAPRFLAGEGAMGNHIDRGMPARDAGA